MRISNSQPLLSSYSLQQAYSNGSQAGDTKRRRKTPPVSPEESTGESTLLRRAPVSPRCLREHRELVLLESGPVHSSHDQ